MCITKKQGGSILKMLELNWDLLALLNQSEVGEVEDALKMRKGQIKFEFEKHIKFYP